jgi:hypothetical protein
MVKPGPEAVTEQGAPGGRFVLVGIAAAAAETTSEASTDAVSVRMDGH